MEANRSDAGPAIRCTMRSSSVLSPDGRVSHPVMIALALAELFHPRKARYARLGASFVLLLSIDPLWEPVRRHLFVSALLEVDSGFEGQKLVCTTRRHVPLNCQVHWTTMSRYPGVSRVFSAILASARISVKSSASRDACWIIATLWNGTRRTPHSLVVLS